jgi:UDP-N-acetylmuramoyl-L-alanyl-D-glutamate--2,6-diaminopimelate ligase
MRLLALARTLKGIRVEGKGDPSLSGLSEDSRTTRRGELFFCLPGSKVDGRLYARQAVDRGAAALLVEGTRLKDMKVPQLVAKDSRGALAALAHAYYGDPSSRVRVVGVTGTKGKTTTTYLIRSILEIAGERTGLIGTIAYQVGKRTYDAPNTTPSALVLAKLLREMAEARCSWAVMEVSSHALEMKRVAGLKFRGAVFTNLGRDHLDYHKTFANYFRAKRRLFTEFPSLEARAVNADDPYGRRLLKTLGPKAVGYGVRVKCAYQASRVCLEPTRLSFTLQGRRFQAPLTGLFNLYNSLAAISVLRELGLPWEALLEGLAHAPAVPGRFEKVSAGQPFTVLVDYAHTPDALQQALDASRALLKRGGKLISVFGCGGDRDRTKRPLMGGISAKSADLTVITSDNPRTEDPKDILREVAGGVPAGLMRGGRRRVLVEEDRSRAIRKALSMADPGDLVLIAGKGHETYQIVGTRKRHFDDREEAKKALKSMGHR